MTFVANPGFSLQLLVTDGEGQAMHAHIRQQLCQFILGHIQAIGCHGRHTDRPGLLCLLGCCGQSVGRRVEPVRKRRKDGSRRTILALGLCDAKSRRRLVAKDAAVDQQIQVLVGADLTLHTEDVEIAEKFCISIAQENNLFTEDIDVCEKELALHSLAAEVTH